MGHKKKGWANNRKNIVYGLKECLVRELQPNTDFLHGLCHVKSGWCGTYLRKLPLNIHLERDKIEVSVGMG